MAAKGTISIEDFISSPRDVTEPDWIVLKWVGDRSRRVWPRPWRGDGLNRTDTEKTSGGPPRLRTLSNEVKDRARWSVLTTWEFSTSWPALSVSASNGSKFNLPVRRHDRYMRYPVSSLNKSQVTPSSCGPATGIGWPRRYVRGRSTLPLRGRRWFAPL